MFSLELLSTVETVKIDKKLTEIDLNEVCNSYFIKKFGSRRRTWQQDENGSVEHEEKGTPVQDYQQGQEIRKKIMLILRISVIRQF